MKIVGTTGLILAAALAASGCDDGKAAAPGEKGAGGGSAAKSKGNGNGNAKAGGQLTSAEAAARFTAWTPIPAFLSAPVIGGAVVGDKGAIVFIKDHPIEPQSKLNSCGFAHSTRTFECRLSNAID